MSTKSIDIMIAALEADIAVLRRAREILLRDASKQTAIVEEKEYKGDSNG
jgi:hypothetical protein